ncbi:MAG: hypothetical protein RRY38_04010 [Oscillospiraceae bacterium]
MLADCRRTAVAPGMTYSEVRTLVPIVPTALFVNDNFYTVCYGKYLGGTEIKHQFEFVVSFSLGSNVAETIFDNVAEEVPANAA